VNPATFGSGEHDFSQPVLIVTTKESDVLTFLVLLVIAVSGVRLALTLSELNRIARP